MSIAKRLDACMRRWPRSLTRDFRSYAGALNRRNQGARQAIGADRFWILLPGWLLAAYSSRRKKKNISGNFLSDIRWAQYCLFLFFRIQDDLFDAQATNPTLLFAADQFLVEAESALSKHLGTSPRFWQLYREALAKTARALVVVAELQRARRAAPQALLAGYAESAAVFNVAPAAICSICAQMKNFSRLAKFTREMTIAGQIMDDLQDVGEDLQQQKYNYAARVLLRHRRKGEAVTKKTLEMKAETILLTDGVMKLLDEARQHLARAEEAIAPIGLRPARALVRRYQRGLDWMQDKIHRRQVDFLFGKIRPRRGVVMPHA